MTIQGLDHVNIRVCDMEATAAFFVDAAARPVIHLGSPNSAYPSDAGRPFMAQDGSGAVHHKRTCHCRRIHDIRAYHVGHSIRPMTMTVTESALAPG